jgi:hypothetical protein
LRIAASLGGNKRIATDARKRLPFVENALAKVMEQARNADIEAATAAEAAMDRKTPAKSECDPEPTANYIPVGPKPEVVASLQTFVVAVPA